MAEHLPGAIQVFSRALGVNEAELFKMMERGELLAASVLPKVAAEFRRTAREGGAYGKALESLRVEKGRFVTESQRAGDLIFKSGFEEGLSDLYGQLSKELKETGKTQEDLGNIYKKFFKLITSLVKVVTPILEAFIQSVSKGVDFLGWLATKFSDLPTPIQAFTVAVGAATIGVKGLSLALKSVYAQVFLVINAFQELASLFDDKLVGALESKLGYQINLATGEKTGLRKDEKGQFFSTGVKESLYDMQTLKDMFKDTETAAYAVATAILGVGGIVWAIKKAVAAMGPLLGGMKKLKDMIPGKSSKTPKTTTPKPSAKATPRSPKTFGMKELITRNASKFLKSGGAATAVGFGARSFLDPISLALSQRSATGGLDIKEHNLRSMQAELAQNPNDEDLKRRIESLEFQILHDKYQQAPPSLLPNSPIMPEALSSQIPLSKMLELMKSSSSPNTTITFGDITVNSAATDVTGIANDLTTELESNLEAYVKRGR